MRKSGPNKKKMLPKNPERREMVSKILVKQLEGVKFIAYEDIKKPIKTT